MPTAKPTPGKLLLSPSDHTLILIDFRSQMAFTTKSIDPVVLPLLLGPAADDAKSIRPTSRNQSGGSESPCGALISHLCCTTERLARQVGR
jgi:hypothetical protein